MNLELANINKIDSPLGQLIRRKERPKLTRPEKSKEILE